MSIRVLQANLNNQGGAFSVAYEAQKKLGQDYVFDFFSPEKFINNTVYQDLLNRGCKCFGGLEIKGRFFKQWAVYKAFKKLVEDNNYSFVHIHADTAWKILVYYIAAKEAGVSNIVVHSHSSGIAGHYRKLNLLLHFLCRSFIKRAKYRCACSDVAAEWMFGTTDKVIIIQNGVDIEKFKFNEDAREKIRKHYSIKDNVKVIGCVSDFSYPKNPEFILKLIHQLKNRNDYIFFLIGNREKCNLKDWVVSEYDIKNVFFLGQVTNVEDYLSAMDIFILPSRFEGLPMCALEAQVNGLYTIISNNVTAETRKSKYFARLKLDKKLWIKAIFNAVTVRDRSMMSEFIDTEKISSLATADGFRRIYENGK